MKQRGPAFAPGTRALDFSFSVPTDLMAYASWISEMPAYSTVYNAFKGLATHEATITAAQTNGVPSVRQRPELHSTTGSPNRTGQQDEYVYL